MPLGTASGLVTLVEGSAFCLSARSGDIHPGGPLGVFVLDRRVLSRLELTIDEQPVEPLAVTVGEPFAATFVGRGRPDAGRADSALLVLRERQVESGLRETITLRHFGTTPRTVDLRLALDADFADLFAVKEGRATQHGGELAAAPPGGVRFTTRAAGLDRETLVQLGGEPVVDGATATWQVTLPGPGAWSVTVEVTPGVAGVAVRRAELPAATRMARWRSAGLTVTTTYQPLAQAVTRSLEDIGALQMTDPDHPERVVVAAGAPWFMALFGRDSLITSWMSLVTGPDLARGVLETLADRQGTRVDPETEEEPGRILHELRFGHAGEVGSRAGHAYYGSVDATPLFVMLLGELRRWGLADDVVARLLPHADRAIEWIEGYGDRDGDGYVEYQRATPRGLANQGWKDSWDGVPFVDGSLAEPPVALCEVQGYVYGAYLARAYFAEEHGDTERAVALRARAAALKAAFNRDFWLPDRGWFALGLDRDKRPIDVLASNMGHCLWTGIVDEDKAALVADHLLSPEMFSGWGVRTLATSMPSYNPLSYHNGSVWPHDNALIVAGLMRYGFVQHAHRIMLGILDAAAAHEGRLPELFSGLSRDDVPTPVAYPTSCSPQAWSAATPLLFLRNLLRLDPWVPYGRLWVAPALPPEMRDLVVDRLPVAGGRLRVAVRDGAVEVAAPPGLLTIETGRPALTGTLGPD